MSNSTKITDYLGIGVAASRPSSAPVAAGCMALYYATDTTVLSGWNGSAWVTLISDAASAWSAGSVSAVATGLSIASTTLVPDWQAGTVTTIGPGVSLGSGSLTSHYQAGSLTTFNTGLTLNSGTLTPNYQAGSVSAVGTGLSITSGTLTPNYQAGSVSAVGTGLSITSGTLTPNYQAGSLTTFNTGLTLNSGTLTPNYQAGSVSALGSGLTLTSGTLTAAGGGGGAVTTVVAGANLTGGTITGSGTIALQASPTITITGSTAPVLFNGNTAVPAAANPSGTDVFIVGADTQNARLLLDAYGGTPQWTGRRAQGTLGTVAAVQSGNALFNLGCVGYGATGYSSVTRAAIVMTAAENWSDTAQGTGINFQTTGTGGTTTGIVGTITSQGILVWGTNTPTPSGSAKVQVVNGFSADTLTVGTAFGTLPLGTGLAVVTGSLVPNWQAGSIASFSTGISLSSTTLSVAYQAGSLSAIGAGLTLSSGTLSSTSVITAANTGAVINSGTVQVDNNVTLTGTNSGTTTIAPGSGTSWVVLNMPTTTGTVTVAAAPAFKGQRTILDISFGATVSTPSLNSGFVFTGGISSYTPGTVVSAIDRFELFSPDGTHWVPLALSQGGTL